MINAGVQVLWSKLKEDPFFLQHPAPFRERLVRDIYLAMVRSRV
jgi:hypothetical protein